MNGITRPSGHLLETDVLRTFVAIAETRSFTKAAGIVGRTPSAVSMQIKKLEETVGRPVFSREARSVSLTEDGEALLSYARRMLMLNDEALSRFRQKPVDSVVCIGAPDDFGTRFLPNILSRFALTHPGVQVDVRLTSSAPLKRAVDDGELDLSLVTVGANDTVQGEVVFSEELVWTGLKSGCAWCRDPVPLALCDPDCAWRQAALAALDRAGRRYRIAYTSQHCAGQMAAILADLAIAPWPASHIEPPLVDLGGIEGLPPIGSYQLALRRGHKISAAAEALARDVLVSFEAERAKGVAVAAE